MDFKKSYQQSNSYISEEEIAKRLEGRDLPSLDLAYEESRRTIEIQIDRIDATDTKASVIVGFAGLILASLFGALSSFLNPSPNIFSIVIIGLAALSTAVSAAFGLYAYHLNPDFYMSPSPQTLRKQYIQWQTKHVKYRFLGQLARITTDNHTLLSNKLRWISRSLIFMLGGIFLTAIVLLINLF